MKIGYLYTGTVHNFESGVIRYGKLLMNRVKELDEVTCDESSLTFSDNFFENIVAISKAVKKLSDADLVHMQYSYACWPIGWKKVLYLAILFYMLPVPVNVTLHDLYEEFTTLTLKQYYVRCTSNSGFSEHSPVVKIRHILGILKAYILHYLSARVAIQIIGFKATRLYVCTLEEKAAAQNLIKPEKIAHIPHFVEVRNKIISKLEAKSKLGLSEFLVITVQGFIYPSKGHDILINALKYLEYDNYKVIFAGGIAPANELYLAKLNSAIKKRNLQNHFIITGYLGEEILEQYLIATDIAVCPFRRMSASGSLSTWISLGKKVIAPDFPQIREYNQLEKDSIITFETRDPKALAEKINHEIALLFNSQNTELEFHDKKIKALQDKLSILQVSKEHLKEYKKSLYSSDSFQSV